VFEAVLQKGTKEGDMLVERVRRQGNSLGLTIPKEEAERLGLREGDLVAVSLNRVRVHVQLPADVEEATEAVLREFRSDLDYLKDR
jgi:antitoxin component of MazEF toxin-antitoxin module